MRLKLGGTETVGWADDLQRNADGCVEVERTRHRGDVRLDGSSADRDHTLGLERRAEGRPVERDVLANQTNVTDRPGASGGCHIGAGATVADRNVCRLAGGLSQGVELRLGCGGQAIE